MLKPHFIVQLIMFFLAFLCVLAIGSSLETNNHEVNSPQPIITGLYNPAQIIIHEKDAKISWNWTIKDIDNNTSSTALGGCLKTGYSVTDAKWVNDGKSILAIFGYAAIIINFCPQEPQKDKKVTFGLCLNTTDLSAAHSVELVADHKLAIATNSANLTKNIKIVDTSVGLESLNVTYLQELDGLPAAHSLQWDEAGSTLWAVGNDNPAQGKNESRSILVRYDYDHKKKQFGQKPTRSYNIYNEAVIENLSYEWPSEPNCTWWDGGHYVSPIPLKRQLLITTDLGISLFDIKSESFICGHHLLRNGSILQGFEPVYSHRYVQPLADIKSVSVSKAGEVLYVQADWGGYSSNVVNLLSNGKKQQDIKFAKKMYRSRWFSDIPGWPSARSANQETSAWQQSPASDQLVISN